MLFLRKFSDKKMTKGAVYLAHPIDMVNTVAYIGVHVTSVLLELSAILNDIGLGVVHPLSYNI